MDRQTMKDPSVEAARAIVDVIRKGSAKSGSNENWRNDPMNYHLDRALRHIITYKLIAEGNQTPDGEPHLKLALTRIAMALCISA